MNVCTPEDLGIEKKACYEFLSDDELDSIRNAWIGV